MNKKSEERSSFHFPFRFLLAVIGIGGLVAICIFVSIPKGSMPGSAGVPPTASPTPRPTATKLEEDTPNKNEDISSQTQPSKDEVMDFEEAYNTPDPKLQLSLLEKVATPQYIAAEYSATPFNVDKLVVKVNRSTSSYSVEVDPENTYCIVTTNVNLQSSRNGKPVDAYPAPQHSTVWINTPDGWKVASEKR